MEELDVAAGSAASQPSLPQLQLQSLILRQVSDAVISISNTGIVTYLNPAAERQYASTVDRAVGQPLSALYTFEWIAPEDEALAEAALAKDGFWRGENLHRLADGTVLHVHSSGSVLHDTLGAPAGLLAVIRDVTRAKRAEQTLRDAHERHRMALDAAALGTWKHRIDNGCVELDPRAREHYGVDAECVDVADILARIHRDDVGMLREAMACSLDPAVRAPVRAEYRVVKPDGHACWLAINGVVHFQDTPGGPARAIVGIGTTRDITDQKHAEEVLREADRRKDEFLAILAHELRNPLAPIRTAVGILRTPGMAESLLARSREVIERQVAHMTRLIDDLLDVSRLSRGQMHLQRGPLVLDQVLDAAIETARPWIQARRHTLEQKRLPRLVCLDGDLARLSQVFANLLNNAAKFTAPGGTIRLDVDESGASAMVSIADTGAGIAPEHLEGIFDLFVQEPGGAADAGGLGIGLALARRLVELHGGTLTASSQGKGRGSTFTVTLPAATGLQAGCEQAAADPPRRRNLMRRVLVVDDNIDAAETTAALLRSAGCEVAAAFSGEQALAQCPEFRPDVVLLDLGMPGLSGFETCARLRRAPGGADLFIAAITGWGQDEDRRRTASSGFDAHLVKPVPPEAVLNLVEQRRGH